MTANRIRLADLFRYYKGLPHQMAAVSELEAEILRVAPVVLSRDQDWFKTWSQAGKQPEIDNNWQGVMVAAAKAGAKFPELVAAQWALESSWGKHTAAEHNYFGLKGSGTSSITQEYVNGKWITISDSFINFPDLESCIVYLVDHWYKNFGQYKGVNRAETRDEAAKMLVSEGYATDPAYATKLIDLMNQQGKKAEPKADSKILEKVPYFSQRDSTVAGQANRMCFSSSCAMLAAYLRPNELRGAAADDLYLKRVFQYGDTTDAQAQLKALGHYGIKAKFVQNATFDDLVRQIDAGVPVPCGFLHHGIADKPTGTGHWLCVIGYTKDAFIVHDPFGELDLINGIYINSNGAKRSYSRKNWGPRWLVEGAQSGWALMAS